MIISKEWVIEYLKTKGTKFIIPKEVTKIEEEAFSAIFGYGSELQEETIEVTFEDDSSLQEIGKNAFGMCKISNKVIVPRSIRIIGDMAFYGCENGAVLQDGTRLEQRGKSTCVFFDQEKYTVPNKEEKLKLEEEDRVGIIIVPNEASLKNISNSGCTSLRGIEFPNGRIDIPKEEMWGRININENTYIVRLRQDEAQKYRIFDKDTLEVLQEGKMNLASNGYIFEDSVFRYDSIYDVDTTKFDDDNDIYFCFGNIDDDYWFNNGRGIFKGQIYTKEEVKEIQGILFDIIGKVNVPPEGIPNREKIKYAQIIKNLNDHLTLDYDYETYNLIEDSKKSNTYSYETMHEDEACQIDSAENLKGLLKGKTVCGGFSTIVETLAQHFGIDCKRIENEEHAWNYVRLDGKYYEDDFTWYKDRLQVSDIAGIDTFLKGRNKKGKRTFDSDKYHQLDGETLDLSEDISEDEKFNLLTTDWSNIQDWESVDITKPAFSGLVNGFPLELKEMAESKKTICLVALRKIKNVCISSTKNFINKVQDLIFGEQDR